MQWSLESPTGGRGMAVILMLARLGARAGQVAGLTLDDIHWRELSFLADRVGCPDDPSRAAGVV